MSVVDIADLELHRTALTGHCYRMLGSAFDAEDAVQEAMVRAWNDALSARDVAANTLAGAAARRTFSPVRRESVRTGCAAPEHSPGVCRGAPASAFAAARGAAAQRGARLVGAGSRGVIGDVRREPLSKTQAELLEKYVYTFQQYDVDALVALMREDATLSMPPYTLWLQGPDAIRAWLLGRGSGCRGSKLVRTEACGAPAFAQYRKSAEGGYRAWSLTVLELEGDRIKAWNAFLDTERLFPLFGLPLTDDFVPGQESMAL